VRRDGFPEAFDLLARIDREFQEFAPVLKLAVPGKPLVEYLVAEALVG
jgi:hypothetical protein